MSIRLDMLQAARNGAEMLGQRGRDQMLGFLQSQSSPTGGFLDRAGKADVYYTVFGVEATQALGARPALDVLEEYLRGFAGGQGLDFVHLACLARSWASLPSALPSTVRQEIIEQIATHRRPDGGFHEAPGEESSSAYGCFLALAAYQDLGAEFPQPENLLAALEALRQGDGSYSNDRQMPIGLTPSTAAAVIVRKQLGANVPAATFEWLRARHTEGGGFAAMPDAPIADLLSTATALHALAACEVPLTDLAETCGRFVSGLLGPQGGFAGSWADPVCDSEYTYYGLIALGHLA